MKQGHGGCLLVLVLVGGHGALRASAQLFRLCSLLQSWCPRVPDKNDVHMIEELWAQTLQVVWSGPDSLPEAMHPEMGTAPRAHLLAFPEFL